jgi:hypothetical protein
MRRIAIICLFLVFKAISYAQEVPEHISNAAIYEFLDELANQQVITLNTVVKPYARLLIAQKLKEAALSRAELNKRQLGQLDFYLRAYRLETGKNAKSRQDIDICRKDNLSLSLLPPGAFYKDSLLTVSLLPILGYTTYSNGNGRIYHSWGGLDFKAYVGKHWGIYSSLRDNHESELMALPSYFTQIPGGTYKINEGGRKGGDYSEMRGGLIYSWNWGSFGLIKDHFEWGNNYNGSNIFSGRTPSFAQLSLHLNPVKWLDFHYIHGWLVSEVVDSARTYNYGYGTRTIFREKYIAANIFTITPFKRLNFSFGNSIVYSDINIQAAYLIPFLFYKSVDHTLNHNIENQNSQMFFDISSRQIKHVHLFTSLFVDEFSISRVGDKSKNNFIGWKFGGRVSNILNKNVTVTAEYTQTSPITYQHKIPAVTFESNKYNLGHYLRDNSREIFITISYKPVKQLFLEAGYTLAQHGNDYYYTDGAKAITYPFMKEKTWQNQSSNFKIDYEFEHNNHIFAGYTISDYQGYGVDANLASYYLEKYTEPFYRGKTSTIVLGVNIGF